MTDPSPVVKGTLDVLVLKALSVAPMHGFEIVTWLDEHAEARLEIKDSALYQALYRMEARGLLSASWGVTENNRRARYYAIEPAGRRHLEAETARHLRYWSTIAGILTAESGGTVG